MRHKYKPGNITIIYTCSNRLHLTDRITNQTTMRYKYKQGSITIIYTDANGLQWTDRSTYQNMVNLLIKGFYGLPYHVKDPQKVKFPIRINMIDIHSNYEQDFKKDLDILILTESELNKWMKNKIIHSGIVEPEPLTRLEIKQRVAMHFMKRYFNNGNN